VDTLTTREAAAVLGLGPSGMRMLVLRGKLTPLKRGAHPLRFPADDVWRLEAARRGAAEMGEIQAAHDEAGRLASQVRAV